MSVRPAGRNKVSLSVFHISELVKITLGYLPSCGNLPAYKWWDIQVTILASQDIGFTDRSATLAEYHSEIA